MGGIKDIRPYDADLDKINLESGKAKSHRESTQTTRRGPGRPKVSYPENTQDFKRAASAIGVEYVSSPVPYTGILNVSVDNLNMALRMCGIEIYPDILDKVIDVVELLEIKGSDTSILDIELLKSEWGRRSGNSDVQCQ